MKIIVNYCRECPFYTFIYYNNPRRDIDKCRYKWFAEGVWVSDSEGNKEAFNQDIILDHDCDKDIGKECPLKDVDIIVTTNRKD